MKAAVERLYDEVDVVKGVVIASAKKTVFAGGDLKGASGVDASQFLGAAKLGVTKINIDTDGRLVWCRVHREFFRDKPEKFDLRDPGKVFMPEYAKFIAAKNVLLGSAGQVDDARAYIQANK